MLMRFFANRRKRKEALARRQEALTEYARELANALCSNLTAKTADSLRTLARRLEISDEDRIEADRHGCRSLWLLVISDDRVDNEEKVLLETAYEHLNIEPEDAGFDQTVFNRTRALTLLEAGTPATVETVPGLPIRATKGELFYWCCPAAVVARKQRTTAIHYAGVSASIRIMRGVRYRSGSMQVSRSKEEYLSTEDVGLLWLSTKRLGFHGPRKSFSIAWEKVTALEVTTQGLRIYKDGRETPYLVTPDSLEMPAAVASWALNEGS